MVILSQVQFDTGKVQRLSPAGEYTQASGSTECLLCYAKDNEIVLSAWKHAAAGHAAGRELRTLLKNTFDGDTTAIYRIHSKKGQEELKENAYVLNNIQFDQNEKFLQTIRIESVFAAFTLLNSNINKSSNPPFNIDNIINLPENEDYLFNYNRSVYVSNNKLPYSYGVVLFNKWAGFKDVVVKEFCSPNNISEFIYKDCQNNEEYHNRISYLSRKLFWFVSVDINNPLTVSIDEIAKLSILEDKKLLQKLPLNPYIGQHIYKAIMKRVYDNIPTEGIFNTLISAGLGKVSTQLARMVGAIGYIADDQNIINPEALAGSVFDGLDPDTFFKTSSGARKGLVDKNQVTPDSGYLERSLVVNLSPIEIDSDDCGTNLGFQITIQNKSHAKSLINRYYSYNGNWEIFTNDIASNSVGQTYLFRSPITCQQPNLRICRKCFGNYNIKTPYIGVLAGQYISERLTQMSLRTFHTSGSCDLPTDSEIVDFIYKHLIDIEYFKENTKINLSNPQSQIIDTLTEIDNDYEIHDLQIIQKNSVTLKFNKIINQNVYEKMKTIPGFHFIRNNTAVFAPQLIAENEDVTKVIKDINKLLLTEKGNITPIDELYYKYLEKVLQVGDMYSVFVEVVLANMYITKNKEVLRYELAQNIQAIPYKKLNIKKLHTIVSKLLGLLYEPNKTSLYALSDPKFTLPETRDTILERLWQDTF